ncbi:hypothetical protein ACFVTC_19700 [Streptomyces sp. NPDC057950]|uniref:hypothetical protein n=1 Tax=Streptomyces sp. NPDC057950 TaxID=3346288 RepID=UPI0036E3EC95
MRRRALPRTAPAAIVGGPGHGGTARAADPGPASAAVYREKTGGTTPRALHAVAFRLPA